MTLSIVQSAQASAATGTTTSVVLGAAPTEGNMLLAFTFGNANAAGDSLPRPDGSLWEPVSNNGLLGNAACSIWYRYAEAGESATTGFTASGGVSAEHGAAVYEVTSSVGQAVICAAQWGRTSPASGTHVWPTITAEPGIAFACAWLSSSGGGSSWNNAWTDGFAQSRLFELSRAVVATRTLTATTSVAPTNTSAASKLSAQSIVSVGERPARRPHARQWGRATVNPGNDPTVNLTLTPEPGNLLLMIGTGTADYGAPPAGFTLLDSAVAPDGFARIAAWTKVAEAGEPTSYLLDTTTSENHQAYVLELELCGFRPLLSVVRDEDAASTTIVSGTLPLAAAVAWWFSRHSAQGGQGVPNNDYTNDFSASWLLISGTGSQPPTNIATRWFPSDPVANVSTQATRSAARSAAGLMFTLEWAPELAMGRAFDSLQGRARLRRTLGRAHSLG